MLGLIHGVSRIAQVGIHMADGVADRAGDGGLAKGILRNRVIRIIPSWIVKCPREERNGVVTAGTKTTGLGVAISSGEEGTRVLQRLGVRAVVETGIGGPSATKIGTHLHGTANNTRHCRGPRRR